MTMLPYLLWPLLLNRASGFLQPNAHVSIRTWSMLEKPKWLDDAMGEFKEEGADQQDQRSMSLTSGISGFSIDPGAGFVAILANNDKRWTPVLISTIDKDRVKSPEALTCVQLAGGLDLGTAILPPDQLAKLIGKEDNERVQYLRRRVSLAKVLAIPNEESVGGDDGNKNGLDTDTVTNNNSTTTPERDQMIKDGQNKVFKAIRSLPGLDDATLDQVFEAMQLYANDEGNVDREAFSNILEYLRNPSLSSSSLSKVKFELLVNILNDDGVKQTTVFTDNAMIALGLSMRYKVKVDISDDCQLEEQSTLLERFPVFQSKYELYEEAKLIDGFIPNMFNRATLDNDQKQ